jgi:hypothetical protein
MSCREAAALVAAIAALGFTAGVAAQFGGGMRGGFGGVEGGGARPTGGSSMGFNRAGTASSGGFAYGDAPRREPTVTVVPQGGPGPCNVAPVTVDNTPYYKCGDAWYALGLTGTGIGYLKVAPPPGY